MLLPELTQGVDVLLVPSQFWDCSLKCLVKLLVEIHFIVFRLVSSGCELHIGYRRAGLGLKAKLVKTCIKLQCFMEMYHFPCSFYQTGLCDEGLREREERSVGVLEMLMWSGWEATQIFPFPYPSSLGNRQ